MSVRLYLVTADQAAGFLERTGFPDKVGGLLLTDDPVGWSMSRGGRPDEVFLAIDLSATNESLTPFEFLDSQVADSPPVIGRNYREWVLPARWLREHVLSMERVEDDDDGKLLARLKRDRRRIPKWAPRRAPTTGPDAEIIRLPGSNPRHDDQ